MSFLVGRSVTVSRWKLNCKNAIVWDVQNDKQLPHSDNLEMSGQQVSVIANYTVDVNHRLKVSPLVIWPNLIVKYDGRSYLQTLVPDSIAPSFMIDGKKTSLPAVTEVRFDGILEFRYSGKNYQIKRQLFPSTENRVAFDCWEIENKGSKPINVTINDYHSSEKVIGADAELTYLTEWKGASKSLKKGESLKVSVQHTAFPTNETKPEVNAETEKNKRNAFIAEMNDHLQLETPDPVLNQMFLFAKIRTSESLFKTALGLVHSPGGGRYYGGVWANDQVEYAGPFFPYLGYQPANEASMNAYRIFMQKMTPEYKAIPSSFEMQVKVPWDGAGDRGDAAMYAYGASLFALASGDPKISEELWPAIRWGLEYSERKMTPEGVIASRSDEMEGRIATGSANLSTSALAYGAFQNAANLGRSIHAEKYLIDHFDQQAQKLRQAIETYFGADIKGYHTYKYFKEHEKLRHWICLPMVMGINDRQEGTTNALLKELWTSDGLLVEEGLDNFWDRATLYALRGIFRSGATNRALDKLQAFSKQRLLGNHVPYAVEAYPEGNQAHLAAESALYCRIFTEGLFAIQPTGLHQFDCIPHLPQGWKHMVLKNIYAFNTCFDLSVKSNNNNQITVTVSKGDKILFERTDVSGTTFKIKL
ncbi:MAG: hypothetical protein Q8859_00875 [Bacteroidota bacterium]|nr:hypothetical protein [Bacteroidota bacterium]